MEEDRLVHVLEEIRDLQRQQVEAYARALVGQQEALRVQREAVSRARRFLWGVGVIIVIVLTIVLVLLRYSLQHYV